MRRACALALLCITAGLGLAACGGDGDKDEGESSSSALTCDGDEFTGDLGLPAKFPKPPELTYVGSEQQGPTRVVTAYFEGALESAYNDYKEGFEGAGYEILFDEIEGDEESEVSYEDPQSKTTGLVALKSGCDESDRISVRITNRPE